jgi:hypothetical protein
MDISNLPEPLRRRMEGLNAEPPLEIVRLFLGTHFGDAQSLDEVRRDLERLARSNIRSHQRHLAALEAVIADPPDEPNALAHLVGWDGNWVLDDPSDAGSLQFLREVADMLRTVIAAAPATATRWS